MSDEAGTHGPKQEGLERPRRYGIPVAPWEGPRLGCYSGGYAGSNVPPENVEDGQSSCRDGRGQKAREVCFPFGLLSFRSAWVRNFGIVGIGRVAVNFPDWKKIGLENLEQRTFYVKELASIFKEEMLFQFWEPFRTPAN